jgi:hypothetical protein
MTWGKRLIIALGLMLLTHVAHALGIEKFTDSQGTLHITNLGPKKPENQVNQPSPGASHLPSRLRNITPAPSPAKEVSPKAAAPEPEALPEPEPETLQEPEPGMIPPEPPS